MAELPEKVKEMIKTIATNEKVEPKVILDEVQQAYNSDLIQAQKGKIPPETMLRSAVGIVMKRHRKTPRGDLTKLHFRPYSPPTSPMILNINNEPTKISKVHGASRLLQQVSDNGDTKWVEKKDANIVYGTITGWREGSNVVQTLNSGKEYIVDVSVKGNGDFSINDEEGTEVEEVESPIFQPAKEYFAPIIDDEARQITLADIPLQKSESPNDLKVLKGVQVIDADIIKSRDGKELGRYSIGDETNVDGYPIFCSKEELVNGPGAEISLVGEIIVLKKSGEARFISHFIRTDWEVPYDMVPKPPEEDINPSQELGEEQEKVAEEGKTVAESKKDPLDDFSFD